MVHFGDIPAFLIHGACISAGAKFLHGTFWPVPTRAVRGRRYKGVVSVARPCDSFSSLVSVCFHVFLRGCDSFPHAHSGANGLDEMFWPVPTRAVRGRRYKGVVSVARLSL